MTEGILNRRILEWEKQMLDTIGWDWTKKGCMWCFSQGLQPGSRSSVRRMSFVSAKDIAETNLETWGKYHVESLEALSLCFPMVHSLSRLLSARKTLLQSRLKVKSVRRHQKMDAQQSWTCLIEVNLVLSPDVKHSGALTCKMTCTTLVRHMSILISQRCWDGSRCQENLSQTNVSDIPLGFNP